MYSALIKPTITLLVRMANIGQTEVNKINHEMSEMKHILRRLVQGVKTNGFSINNMESENEKIDDRITVLEEEVADLRAQNMALRDHLNFAVKVINDITEVVNNNNEFISVKHLCCDEKLESSDDEETLQN